MVTASRTQIQERIISEYGNAATTTGTGAKIALVTIQTATFRYIYTSIIATTVNSTVYIDGSVDGVNFNIPIVNGTAVTAGTATSLQTAIPNVGYRAIRVSANQGATGTTDVYWDMIA